MTVTIVIPVKAFADAKTRLMPVLDAQARAALARSCFEHVLATARSAACHHPEPCRIEVHSGCPDVLALARPDAVTEQGIGLNAILATARRASIARGDRAMIALFADLPGLREDEVIRLIDGTLRNDVVLAPDRAGTGTNALGLSAAVVIPFSFGLDSCTAFRTAAAALDLRIAEIRSPGLAHDIDIPGDLTHASVERLKSESKHLLARNMR